MQITKTGHAQVPPTLPAPHYVPLLSKVIHFKNKYQCFTDTHHFFKPPLFKSVLKAMHYATLSLPFLSPQNALLEVIGKLIFIVVVVWAKKLERSDNYPSIPE